MATKNPKLKVLLQIMVIGLLAVIPSCMVIPFMTVELKRLGFSETSIGLYSALPWLGLLIISPFVSRIIGRFGVSLTYKATGLISILHCLSLLYANSIYLWGLTNFIFGFVWGLRWITTETLVNDYAPEGKKGKALGIYGTIFCAFVAGGPLLLLLTGVDTKLPLYITLVFFVLSWLVTMTLPRIDYIKHEKAKKGDVSKFIKGNMLLLFAGFIAGIFENGLGAPSILYGISVGIADKFAAIIPAVISGGTFATQYLVGVMTDKYRHKNLFLIMSSILLAFTLLAFYALMQPYFIYVPAFVWGAFGGGIYTMTLILFGYKYTAGELVAANSYLVIVYTLGSLSGPILGGASIEIAPQHGLLVLLTALSVAMVSASAKKSKQI